MKLRNEQIIIVILAVALIVVSGVFYVLINENKGQNSNMETVTKNAIGSTVEIICTTNDNAFESKGTGFITSYDDKIIVVSNAHVILLNDAVFDNIASRFYNSSTEYSLSVVAYDVNRDISLMEFEDTILSQKPLKLGDSSKLRYSQEVITVGNALGYGLSSTNGIISSPHVKINSGGEERSVIQTNININRGNSGGPVLDMSGNVIGIMSFRLNNIMGTIQGISFAIPSNTIADYIEQIYR
jgi:serine protease Do